jgi:hypothetical protein
MMTLTFVSLNRHSYSKDLYSFIYIITKEKEKGYCECFTMNIDSLLCYILIIDFSSSCRNTYEIIETNRSMNELFYTIATDRRFTYKKEINQKQEKNAIDHLTDHSFSRNQSKKNTFLFKQVIRTEIIILLYTFIIKPELLFFPDTHIKKKKKRAKPICHIRTL